MINGDNVYDPYSGFGPYGRHNREYTKDEIASLISQLGFSIDLIFTADINSVHLGDFFTEFKLKRILKNRSSDMGQYIFVRAVNTNDANIKKPAWLYRSYPLDEMI